MNGSCVSEQSSPKKCCGGKKEKIHIIEHVTFSMKMADIFGLLRMVHVVSFAAFFGMSIWVGLISGRTDDYEHAT